MSRWHHLQSNTNIPQSSTPHIRCEPAFRNIFGDLPCCIEHSTTLRPVTQNVEGIKPIDTDDKFQGGIANMISLQAGITCLTETNVE
jgi:hypothetical protein